MPLPRRGSWSSRAGFRWATSLAVAGAGGALPLAVGGDGVVSIAAFLATLVVFGFPAFVAEVVAGKVTRRAAAAGLSGGIPWRLLGGLSLVAAAMAAGALTLLAGMWMACAYRVVLGGLSLAGGAQAVTVVFRAASESFPEQAFWALVSGALLTILMRGGIQAFERGAKVGMIAVSVFLAVALGLALGLPAVNPEPPLSGRWMDAFAAVVAALGLGTGMVSVSASYAEPRVPVPSSVAVVLAVRLLVVWIFSSIAARWGVAGGDAALATGAARHLAGESVGAAAAFALYAGAAILALVSACASAECVLAWLVDQFGAERGIASTVVGVGAAAMALVAAATVGATGTLRAAVAVGAVATGGFAIFSSWSLDPARAEAAFGESAVGSVFKLWLWLARVVVPLGAGAAFWAALT